jgi:hypothetical protein
MNIDGILKFNVLGYGCALIDLTLFYTSVKNLPVQVESQFMCNEHRCFYLNLKRIILFVAFTKESATGNILPFLWGCKKSHAATLFGFYAHGRQVE